MADTTFLEKVKNFEDTAVKFFDADQDADLDLFIGSGGNLRTPQTRVMQDRLYVNDGSGNFSLNTKAFPNNGFNTSVVIPMDFDEDGDLDLFVGSRSVPKVYGAKPQHFLYENDGTGKFKNVIKEVAPDLQKLGMITDATLVLSLIHI